MNRSRLMQNRRAFLRQAALGTAGLTLGHWPLSSQAALPGYRALVCVFLFGGNDSFNMVVPRSQAEYDVYAASRQNLAIDRNVLLPITPRTPDGAQYGLHPSMPEMRDLFAAQRMAIVANMGPLIEPVTRDEVLNGTRRVPPQLFSHNDQQDQWHSISGQLESPTGWAGRTADLLTAQLGGQALPMNVSLSGNTLFQVGDQTTPYNLGPDGAVRYGALDLGAALGPERRAAFQRLTGQTLPSIYGRALGSVHTRALQLADVVQDVLDLTPAPTTVFPASPLGRQLELVSRLIAARDQLGASRQVFMVSTGGFDTHDDQVALQPGLLAGISQCLKAFYDETVQLNVDQDVVSFTASDFGRTLTSNGDGTDHGWGGHQLVCGGPVFGQDIYGQMPLLQIGGPDDLDAGRMVPSIAVDQYAATLLRWFGLTEPEIDAVAPNLVNFPVRGLGFV